MLQRVDGAGVGVKRAVFAVNGPVQHVFPVGELVVAHGVPLHIQVLGGHNPGGDIEHGDDRNLLVFVYLNGVVGRLLIILGHSDASRLDELSSSASGFTVELLTAVL